MSIVLLVDDPQDRGVDLEEWPQSPKRKDLMEALDHIDFGKPLEEVAQAILEGGITIKDVKIEGEVIEGESHYYLEDTTA